MAPVFAGCNQKWRRPTKRSTVVCLPLAPETSGERVPRQGRERGQRGVIRFRRQKTEDRGQRTEDRGQRTEKFAASKRERRPLPALPGHPPPPSGGGESRRRRFIRRFSSTFNCTLLNCTLPRWVNPIWPEDDMTRRSGILSRNWALHQAKARFQQPDVGQVCPTYKLRNLGLCVCLAAHASAFLDGLS
jgi:hypothetical protein